MFGPRLSSNLQARIVDDKYFLFEDNLTYPSDGQWDAQIVRNYKSHNKGSILKEQNTTLQ